MAVAPLILTMGYVETRVAMDGVQQDIGVCSDGSVLTNAELYEAEAFLAYLVFLYEAGYYTKTGTTLTFTIVKTGGPWLLRAGPVGIAGGAMIVSVGTLGLSFYDYAQSPNYWLCKYRLPCDRFSSGPYDRRPFSAIACHHRENDFMIADSMEMQGFIDTWNEGRDPDTLTPLAYLDDNCSRNAYSCTTTTFRETFAGQWSDQDYREHGLEPGASCAGCHGRTSRDTPVDQCIIPASYGSGS